MAWESLWHLGWVVLGAVLAWGLWRYHTRNKRNDPVTEEATRELYDHPDTYEERRDELNHESRPKT